MNDGRLPITLDLPSVLCIDHAHDLEAAAASYSIAALIVFAKAVRHPQFLRAAGYDAETDTPAVAQRINPLIAEFSPLCCFTSNTWTETVRWATYPDELPDTFWVDDASEASR